MLMDTEAMKEHLNGAILDIQLLIHKTEEIYGAIYGELPRLEQEIELTLAETTILLEYCIPGAPMLQETGNSVDDMLKLSQVLRRVEENFTKNSQQLVDEQDMLQSVNHFIGNKDGDKDGISALLEIMEKVKERLTEIEIVSLNAIIHAAHLGEAGKAFGVISDNINTISSQVAVHYVQLQVTAGDLKQWNSSFIQGLHEMLKCHNDLTSRQRDDLKQLVDLCFDSLAKINFLLQNLMDNVKNVIHPVQDIMVSIQAQDMIRQSMENLNKCLELIVDSISKHVPERAADNIANLELLNFVVGALELVQKLTDNIEDELLGSLSNLDEQLTDISLRMLELETDGNLLANFLGGEPGHETEGNIVSTVFLQVKGFIQDFSRGLTTLQEQIDGFSCTNNLFYTHITDLEKNIQIIRDRIGFLQKLGILTRIELARLGEGEDSFAQEISGITDRVSEDVNLNEALIRSLKRKLHQELRQFETMLAKNRGKAVSMLHLAGDAGENLEQIEILISGAIQTLSHNCSNLMLVVNDARTHLEEGSRLPAKLQEIKDVLYRLGSDVARFKEGYLASAGLEKWEGTSRELEEMLGNLTTRLERVSAHEVLADVELDVGSESGDLTLF